MAILTPFRHRFYDASGVPLAGGKVYTYIAGTTTPKASYTSSSGLVANTNPVILDSKGEADIWSAGRYKINVTTSADVQVTGWPVDDVGAGQSSYDIAHFFVGKPTSSQVIYAFKASQPFTFDVNLQLSKGMAVVAATAITTFLLKKNGTQFGTMAFPAASIIPAFVCAIPPAFAIDDILTIVAPASADATLSDIGFTLSAAINP